MSLTIRPARFEERDALARLSHLAFAPSKPFAEIRERYKRDDQIVPTTTVAEEDGRLYGKYALLDYQCFLAGKSLPIAGIAGVAVAPEGRGRGVATGLMHHALKAMQQQVYPLSMLYGYRHGFYRRLGWACVGAVYRYRVSTRDLPRFSEAREVVPLDPVADREAIEQLYAREAPTHNGWLVREEHHWRDYFEEEHYKLFGYWVGRTLEGYLVMCYEPEPASSEIAHIAVREWVACSGRAYRGLLGFLAAQRDQVDAVTWDSDAHDPLPKLLQEQRGAHDRTIRTFLGSGFGVIHSSFMWRIVDLDAAFNGRPIQSTANFSINLEVHDPVLGIVRRTLGVEDHQLHLDAQSARTTVKLSVERLTQLWCGYWNAQDAHRCAQLEVEGDPAPLALLDQAWQTAPPFCWDFF